MTKNRSKDETNVTFFFNNKTVESCKIEIKIRMDSRYKLQTLLSIFKVSLNIVHAHRTFLKDAIEAKSDFFVRKTLTLTAVPALRKTTSCHAEGHITTFQTVRSSKLYFALSIIFLSLVLFSLCSPMSSFISLILLLISITILCYLLFFFCFVVFLMYYSSLNFAEIRNGFLFCFYSNS